MARHRLQATQGLARGIPGPAGYSGPVLSAQASQGPAAVGAQALGVSEPSVLSLKRLQFPGCQTHLLDLGQLVGQEILLTNSSLGLAAQVRALGIQCLQALEAGAHGRPLLQKTTRRVQVSAVGFRTEKSLGTVLARNLHPAGQEFAEGRDRDHLPANPSPAATLGRERATDDEFVGVGAIRRRGGKKISGIEFGFEFRQAVGSEKRFHPALFGPFPDAIPCRPASDEQRESAKHNGLARPGLPGEHIEARPELKLSFFDDRNVLDTKGFDHLSPQRSFAWRIS